MNKPIERRISTDGIPKDFWQASTNQSMSHAMLMHRFRHGDGADR